MQNDQFNHHRHSTFESKASVLKMIKTGSLFAGLICAILVTAVWALDDKDSNLTKEGLRGILPEEVPIDLDQDAFEMLSGNWAEWSEEVFDLVLDLYDEEKPELAGQREILEKLNSKIAVMDNAIADKRFKPIIDPLITLRARLDRRVKLSEAILNTLELDPEEIMKKKQEEASVKMTTALVDLESYLNRRQASAWFAYVKGDEIRGLLKENKKEELTPAIVKLFNKLNGRDKLKNEDQKKFLGLPNFVKLEDAAEEYLSANNATYLEVDPKELRSLMADLFNTVEVLEDENTSEASTKLLKILDELKPLLADGGELIADTVNAHYFNYNFRVLVSEYFINRVGRKTESESSTISDYILGANVSGNQNTSYYTGVDFMPSGWGAKFDLTLNGSVTSNTVGMTHYANVYTNGNHSFVARKEMVYDGVNLKSTGKNSTISVNARNTTTGIGVNDGGPLGLFTGVVRSRARQEVANKRGQSEAIARQKIRDKVLPKFDEEIDKTLKEVNDDLENRIAVRLKNAGLYPSKSDIRSSRTHIFMNHQIGESGEPGGDMRNPTQTPNIGITIHFHESLFNNVVDRLNLAGRTMSEDDIVVELESFLSKFLGRDYHFESEEEEKKEAPQPEGDKKTDKKAEKKPTKETKEKDDDGPTTLIFAKKDPIRFRFENGFVNIIIRAGIVQKDKDDIPTQVITIPIHYTIQEETILVQAGTIQVAPVKRPESSSVQIARAGVIRKKLKKVLIDRNHRRSFDYELEDKKPIPISIATVKILNGWAMIWTD